MDSSISKDVLSLAIQAWSNRQNRFVDLRLLAQNVIGRKDDKGQPLMTEMEMKHPTAFLMLNHLAQSLQTLIPDNMGNQLSGSVEPEKRTATEKDLPQTEVSRLREEITRLKNMLSQKDLEIKNLKGER